jgi:hypothetical protein
MMRPSSAGIFLAGVLAVLTTANRASAAVVLFSDSFGGDTVGAQPALQGGDVGFGWDPRTPAGAGASVQVHDDVPGATGNNVVLLHRATASDYGYVHAQLTPSATALTLDNPQVSVSFRFLMQAAATTGEFRLLDFASNTISPVADFTNTAFSFRFLNNAVADPTKTVAFLGTGVAASGSGTVTWKRGLWNDVLIKLDYDAGQLELSVTNEDGTSSAQKLFRTDGTGTKDRLGLLQFTLPVNGTDVVFDDLLITAVPEPAALSLLSLGGIFLCARRRRPAPRGESSPVAPSA